MKIISMILLALFLGRSCDNEQKHDIKSAVIEYSAVTRGFFQKIVIKNQTVSVYKDSKSEDKFTTEKISDADWKFMIKEFQEIDLDDLEQLKAPSEKRFYDGAAIGTLVVTYKDKTYNSASFDHGTPPIEIARLVTKITSLAKNNNDD
jgi:hypothetical protein